MPDAVNNNGLRIMVASLFTQDDFSWGNSKDERKLADIGRETLVVRCWNANGRRPWFASDLRQFVQREWAAHLEAEMSPASWCQLDEFASFTQAPPEKNQPRL